MLLADTTASADIHYRPHVTVAQVFTQGAVQMAEDQSISAAYYHLGSITLI